MQGLRGNMMLGSMPYDYPVEYLESVGDGANQSAPASIDTQWSYDGTSNIKFKFKFCFTKYHKQVPFGCQTAKWDKWIYPFYSTTSNPSSRILYFSNIQNTTICSIDIDTMIEGYMEWGSGQLHMKFNSFDKNYTYSGEFNTQTLRLFSGCAGPNILDDGASMKLYNFSIYENGNKVYNAVPCVKDGKPAIYDSVNNMIAYNTGKTMSALMAGPHV